MSSTALRTNDTVALDPLERLSELHKALADGLRLQILRLLKNESFGVLELCRIIAIKQSALSHHLKILATAELVSTRREGNSIFYRRAFLTDDDDFADIKKSVFEQIDALPIDRHQLKQIRAIQLERSELSLSFFHRHADKFREKQGLIVEHAHYGASLLDVIDGLSLPSSPRVLEVGPGEGQLLLELAAKFKQLTALDNSSEMLERSRAAIAAAGYRQVQFILGDTAVALKQNMQCDLIIFDMVLHHIPSPAKAFKDAAQLLAPAGHLLIIDLGNHDQDWVRESCGDLWLGFDDGDLDHWAHKAGLTVGQSSYLGLRNGFQIKMRVFQNSAHR
jgi:SAM-dependent methyltransferase